MEQLIPQIEIIKIGLVDDHRLMRQAYRSFLETPSKISVRNSFKVIFEADNGLEMIEQLSKGALPDIILLDIQMPEMDGFQTMAWLHENHPSIKVIVMTMHSNIRYVTKMFGLGACAYLTKNSQVDTLLNAIVSVQKGDLFFSRDIGVQLIDIVSKLEQENGTSPILLTEREKQILKLLASEFTHKEIAEKLFLSVRTIDNYRDNLLMKLGVKNKVGLIIYAVKNRLI